MEPLSADEQLEKALRHHTAGELAEAEAIYRALVERDAGDADALHLLGALIAQKGDGLAALGFIDRAIAIDPSCADFHNNKGLILANLGRTDDAVAAHAEAVRLRPDFAEANNNLGNALLKKGAIAEAVSAYRRTIALRPNYANAHSNLGVALQKQQKLDDAIAAYRMAVQCQPDHGEAHSNLGVALRETGRMDEAIEEYRAAIRCDDQCVEAYVNLGAALHETGHGEEAIAILTRAIELDPQHEPAHYNLSLSLLKKGQYERGWREYEHRAFALWARRKFAPPIWDGSELSGKTILLPGEGGFGDAIQFARYVPMVKKRGGRIIVQVQSDLVRLLKRVEGADEVLPKDHPLPTIDVYCPLLSLPRIFGTTPRNIPAAPYLTADASVSQRWASRLSGHKGLRVGLAWAGSTAHRNDKNRSIPLSQFAPLRAVTEIRLFSLQKDRAGESSPTIDMIDWTAQLSDFADTAGLIANLDRVISVDTAVAHLAGAMGKKVWLLLPYVADWRWLEDRSDSPWYPTLQLFRQEKPGDWDPVIAKVAQALKAEQII
ncbi:MAG: tetratricopeptide repeat protein [Tepidisphaeraceae bacterium]